jgi:hypothetical protein
MSLFIYSAVAPAGRLPKEAGVQPSDVAVCGSALVRDFSIFSSICLNSLFIF